jgi:RND family efflux transporter MFP subunit
MMSTGEAGRRADLSALQLERRASRPPPNRRRLAIVAVVVAIVVAIIALRAIERPVEVTAAEAKTVTAGEAPPAELLSGSGYVVTGDRYVSIGVRVGGRIDRYFVEEGQSVRKGDALVQLDDREYRSSVTRAEASLASARANLSLAKAELRRGRRLSGEGVISAQELDTLENRERVARATIAQLEAELSQTRVNLEYTTLRSPADGVVLAKLKEVGEIAVPGGFAGSGDLVRLANLGDLRAEVDVNEADLANVRLGQPARVVPDAYPQTHYDAEVAKLYPQVDRQKGTLKVEVRILKPDAKLLPDMSVRVTFLGATGDAKRTIVLVPAGALHKDETGLPYVWKLDGGVVRRAEVESDGTAGEVARVTRGLAGGERVVVSSPQPLHDGARVRVAG